MHSRCHTGHPRGCNVPATLSMARDSLKRPNQANATTQWPALCLRVGHPLRRARTACCAVLRPASKPDGLALRPESIGSPQGGVSAGIVGLLWWRRSRFQGRAHFALAHSRAPCGSGPCHERLRLRPRKSGHGGCVGGSEVQLSDGDVRLGAQIEQVETASHA